MVQEKEHQFKAGLVNPNSSVNGNRKVTEVKNPKPTGEGNQGELKQVKKEAVEKVLEIEKSGNPTHNGSPVATTQGGHGKDIGRSTVPMDQEAAEKAKKEATID